MNAADLKEICQRAHKISETKLIKNKKPHILRTTTNDKSAPVVIQIGLDQFEKAIQFARRLTNDNGTRKCDMFTKTLQQQDIQDDSK